MSSKIAFLPISASEKAMFNFKALSEQTNAFILALTKSIVALSEFDEESIKACIQGQIDASFASGNGKGKGKKAKKEKSDIKHPKSAYIFFCTEKRAEVKEQNPDMSAKDITVQLASMWKEIDDDTKKVFQELADKDKARYEAEKAEKSSSDSDSEADSESEKVKKTVEKKADKKAEKKTDSKKALKEADKKAEKKTDSKKAEKEADKKAEKKSDSKKAKTDKDEPAEYTKDKAEKFLKEKTAKEIIDWMKQNSQKEEYHVPKYAKNTKAKVMEDALSIMAEKKVGSW
jgi:hypothetical protein